MTKKQRSMLNSFRHATATTLSDVYKSWSAEKGRAYRSCVELAQKYNAISYRICGANTTAFTFAFEYIGENDKHWLDYETAWSSYRFCIE